MPWLRKDNLWFKLNEESKNLRDDLDKKIEEYKSNIVQTLENNFWIKPNLQDYKLSESAKQI